MRTGVAIQTSNYDWDNVSALINKQQRINELQEEIVSLKAKLLMPHCGTR